MLLSGQALININNVTYVEIQHIQMDWYDGYGVQVQGASDHLWLANMVADSQVPNATVPIGILCSCRRHDGRHPHLQHGCATELCGIPSSMARRRRLS